MDREHSPTSESLRDEEEPKDRQNLAILILRHLTNPEVFCYPVRETNLCACLKAIRLAEGHQLHEPIKLPSGHTVTAGRVIEMFRLEQFVDWKKAAKQRMTYDHMVALGIQPERRHILFPRGQVIYNRRKSPKIGHE